MSFSDTESAAVLFLRYNLRQGCRNGGEVAAAEIPKGESESRL